MASLRVEREMQRVEHPYYKGGPSDYESVTYVLRMDEYEMTNLTHAVAAVFMGGGDFPASKLNNGDWLGQLHWALSEGMEKLRIRFESSPNLIDADHHHKRRPENRIPYR